MSGILDSSADPNQTWRDVHIVRIYFGYFQHISQKMPSETDVAPKAIWIGMKSLGEAVLREPSVLIINAKTIENHSNELQ